MPNKHCIYSNCLNNSRINPDLKWASFVKPTKPYNVKRAIRWVHLLGRSDFTISNITKDTFICENHFPPGVVLDWSKNVELEPFPANNSLKISKQQPGKHFNHNYTEKVVEKVANNLKKQEKHSKMKDFTTEEEEDASPILNQCGVCDKKFNNLLELNNHMKSEHSMGSQKFDIKYKDNSRRIHTKKNENAVKNSALLKKDPLQTAENPWEIQSIYDLQFYICPVCRYTNWSKQAFVNHISNIHPEAIENFKRIMDGSLNDINCPWRLESHSE